jgi:putative SOS response-associated peptidase YedK
MCNLYSITTNQAAIIALFRVINRYVGNLPPMPGVFPDYPAPVIRNTDNDRELAMMRWGMPHRHALAARRSPTSATLRRRTGAAGSSRRADALSRPTASPSTHRSRTQRRRKKDVVWFALNDDRPLFAFAGIWTTFNGDRGTKSKPLPRPHQVYSFLTTSPNAVVGRSIRRPFR